MSLQPIRDEIDQIDEQIIELFKRRMDCSKRVAEYKLENGIPIFNEERENQILDSVEEKGGVYGGGARQLYSVIMGISRALQHDLLGSGAKLKNEILSADHTVPFESNHIKVACFGVSGTYAHQAQRKLFPNCTPDFYSTFQDVFSAIQNNEAQFGVVPIENSSAGSVTDVYDLMLKYRFYIAASIEISVNHILAVNFGTAMENIKKIYSHSQALSQCSDFFRRHKNMKSETYVSTAAAAKMLSENQFTDAAVICSEDAAEKYGLEVIARGFQNNPNNTTRFLVIAKKLYIDDTSDKISLCFSLPHVKGSLYSILGRFAIHGLNLTKIESRPIFGTSFEYMFYLDFDGNAKDNDTLKLITALSEELKDFSFLGNYPNQ